MNHNAAIDRKAAFMMGCFAKLQDQYLEEGKTREAGNVNEACQILDVASAAKLYDIFQAVSA